MITNQMEQKAEDDIAEPEEEEKIKKEEAVDQTKSCSQCQVTWTILTEVHISHPGVLHREVWVMPLCLLSAGTSAAGSVG